MASHLLSRWYRSFIILHSIGQWSHPNPWELWKWSVITPKSPWRIQRTKKKAPPPFALEPCLGGSAKKTRFLENCRGICLTEMNHICCSNMAPSTKSNIPGKHQKVTCLRQLWLVLGVRLMEINRNSFSRSLTSLNHQ